MSNNKYFEKKNNEEIEYDSDYENEEEHKLRMEKIRKLKDILEKLQDFKKLMFTTENMVKMMNINPNKIIKNKNKYNNEIINKNNTEIMNENNNQIINVNNSEIINKNNTENNSEIINKNNTENIEIKEIKYFPKHNDQLFWCFYILYNGFEVYELENNFFTAEKQFKINSVEKMNKKTEAYSIIKKYKLSRPQIEGDLTCSSQINLETLYALCIIYNINIFYIQNNCYYEFILDINKPINIIEKNKNKYCFHMPIQTEKCNNNSNKILDYRSKYWKLDNLNKPLKSFSAYSLGQLIEICEKLEISCFHESDTNSKLKKKNKKELYESILQKL